MRNENEKRMRSFEKLLAALQIFFIAFAVMLSVYLFVVQIAAPEP